MKALRIRKVENKDIWYIYEISNDPTVRKFSFSQKPISKEEHIYWFQKVDKRFFFVAEVNNKVVGQIRFTKKKDNLYEVSISIHSEWRGKGIGKKLLIKSLKEFFKEIGNAEVIARVKENNIVSRYLFEKSGFEKVKQENGVITYRFKK